MHFQISRRSLLLSLAAGPALHAQEKEPDKTFSTDVSVVNVFATVRDKKGVIVRDLAKDDFSIEEDGHPQTIRYFAKESNLPLTLGLVVDTSGSMRRVIEQERNASYKFLDQVLREDKDQAFLIHFDSEVELLQDLTSSRKSLQSALNQMDVQSPRQLNRRSQGDPGQQRPRGGTTLYDAVLLASDEIMKKQTGRKALILLSDGVDNASRVTLTDAIASAQRADTAVYTVLFADEQGGQPMGGFGGRGMGRRGGMGRPPMQNRPDGKKIMERLAKETGGGFFEGSKKQTMEDIYRQIQEELRNQYSLGYTPDKNTGPGYRRIQLAVKQKGLIVQARDGYYAAAR
jgi:VWFA-related protein